MSGKQELAVTGPQKIDVLVVGAGFAGLAAIHRFRSQGLSVQCVEAADDIGGVWYHNRYPGARCDVRSIDYSYSFSEEENQEWRWGQLYAEQPEILRYIHFVADRKDLRKDVLLENRVVSARWQTSTNRWLVETDKRVTFEARFFVLCTGILSSPKLNDFPGLDDFGGETYHTSKWPHHPVSFAGKRVGVFGTGASGVQAIPRIAQEAGHLTVFQRTPQFVFPARNVPIDEVEYAEIRSRYPAYRDEVRKNMAGLTMPEPGPLFAALTEDEARTEFAGRWQRGGLAPLTTFSDMLSNEAANDRAAGYVREKIREVVQDPRTARSLMPDDHPLGTRRVPLGSEYFETYNRENVTLVDLRSDPLVEITPAGIRTHSCEYPLDVIVFATGFDAYTGPIKAMDIRNDAGELIMDRWKDGPKTYLGKMVNGFPNLFIVTGPGSPAVFANAVMAGEVDVEWIGKCIAWLDQHGFSSIEASETAETEWTAHVAELANGTLFPKANSWYTGANIPGKPRVFLPYLGGLGNFIDICDAKAAADYEGFIKK